MLRLLRVDRLRKQFQDTPDEHRTPSLKVKVTAAAKCVELSQSLYEAFRRIMGIQTERLPSYIGEQLMELE